jgi:hypothetical protein
LGEQNQGISAAERARVDDAVSEFFALDESSAELVRVWGKSHPPPTSRGAKHALGKA